jgi:hypothetical protein
MWPFTTKLSSQVNTQEAYTLIPVRPEVFEDELMYRQIFTGMQFMLELHAAALKQNFTNDRLRTIYNDFLWEEVSIVDAWIKYGKAKGWLRPVPAYQITPL